MRSGCGGGFHDKNTLELPSAAATRLVGADGAVRVVHSVRIHVSKTLLQ